MLYAEIAHKNISQMIYVKIANQSIVPQKSFLREISIGPLSNDDGIDE